MKNVIQRALEIENVTLTELLDCVEYIKRDGKVIVIKFDGERQENQYTVFITFPAKEKTEMIRADALTLVQALKEVLQLYVEQ